MIKQRQLEADARRIIKIFGGKITSDNSEDEARQCAHYHCNKLAMYSRVINMNYWEDMAKLVLTVKL